MENKMSTASVEFAKRVVDIKDFIWQNKILISCLMRDITLDENISTHRC